MDHREWRWEGAFVRVRWVETTKAYLPPKRFWFWLDSHWGWLNPSTVYCPTCGFWARPHDCSITSVYSFLPTHWEEVK